MRLPVYAKIDLTGRKATRYPISQEMFEKYCGSKDKVGVPISYIPFETGEYYGDLFARPSLGEPWSTIAAEIAPKIDEKIAIAYEK